MNHPKDTGDRTTLAVILALREKKFIVSEPFGETRGTTWSWMTAIGSVESNARRDVFEAEPCCSRRAAATATTFDLRSRGATT